MADVQGVPAEVLVAGIHAAHLPVAVMDDRGEIAYTNESFRLMGYEPGEINGRQALDFVHPDDLERAIAGIAGLAEPGGAFPTPFRMLRKDGTYELLDVAGSAIEAGGRSWVLTTFHFVRFHTALAGTLERLAAGAATASALQHLAERLTAVTDIGAELGIAFDDGSGWQTVGPVPAALVEPASWNAGVDVATPVALDVGSLAGVAPDAHRLAAGRGYVAATFLPTAVDERDHPALIAVWYRTTSTRPLVDAYLIDSFLDVVRLALTVGRSRRELEHLARHDPLTKVRNRAGFFEAVDAAYRADRAAPRPLAIVYLDLDDFKPINDEHGHERGDQVLSTVASRFVHAVRPDDVVARLGGDEFAVLCPDVHDAREAQAIAERLVAEACVPIALAGGPTVTIGSSAGVAFLPDLAAADFATLLRHADEALYRAKRAGKGTTTLTTVG